MSACHIKPTGKNTFIGAIGKIVRIRFLSGSFACVFAAAPACAGDANPSGLPAPDLHQSIRAGFPEENRKLIASHLAKRTDPELRAVLQEFLALPGIHDRSGYEPCLVEITRRGGPHWASVLKEAFHNLHGKELKPYKDADITASGALYSLELLTALRRIQGQPDPLQIEIMDAQEITCAGMELPQLKVRLRNLDREKTAFGVTIGGNYRTGRQERWRVLLENEQGAFHQVKPCEMLSPGGGLFSLDLLQNGDSWETTLNLLSFIEVPPPGKYKLTLQYHNQHEIAGLQYLEDMIVSRSAPIPLTVKPTRIVRHSADGNVVRECLARLEKSKSIKIVAGTYGEWAHDWIPPESAPGRILSMGISAAPSLIECLRDRTLPEWKRGWIVSLLFSLTREHDPRDLKVLEAYEYAERGWMIMGNRPGSTPAGGLSPGSHRSSSSGIVDRDAQEALIATWERWLKWAEVVEAKTKIPEPPQPGTPPR